MSEQKRIVCWFSCGAASAVATKLAIIENAAQAKRIAVYEQFMRTCDKQAAEYELSAQKGTE